ncbi:hypothetical protein AAFF_G00024610 [Aldrovandia affinis]|uniref:Uncharacterized protein n=1 Tax=Aldrovandia affinis TaxID=143900 RepID=A0AAD7T655_9TELE|nr:hypothetical protein AAFF_G00024610 [Aldrovandia affinis]
MPGLFQPCADRASAVFVAAYDVAVEVWVRGRRAAGDRLYKWEVSGPEVEQGGAGVLSPEVSSGEHWLLRLPYSLPSHWPGRQENAPLPCAFCGATANQHDRFSEQEARRSTEEQPPAPVQPSPYGKAPC